MSTALRPAPAERTRIDYDADQRDFAVRVDGRIIGRALSHPEAEALVAGYLRGEAQGLAAVAPAPRKTLKMSEACDVLGIGRTKLTELIHSGELPALKIGDTWRLSVASIDRWIADQEQRHAKQRAESVVVLPSYNHVHR